MPDITVEVRGDWASGRETELLRAVHAAVVDALATPPDEPVARLVVHPGSRFLVPVGAGPRFTLIGIVLFEGRSTEAKRALYRATVARLEPFGVPADDVKVVLHEVPATDVGFHGGRAACDLDLGYTLDV